MKFWQYGSFSNTTSMSLLATKLGIQIQEGFQQKHRMHSLYYMAKDLKTIEQISIEDAFEATGKKLNLSEQRKSHRLWIVPALVDEDPSREPNVIYLEGEDDDDD